MITSYSQEANNNINRTKYNKINVLILNVRRYLLVEEILILLGANDPSQCDLILLNLLTMK